MGGVRLARAYTKPCEHCKVVGLRQPGSKSVQWSPECVRRVFRASLCQTLQRQRQKDVIQRIFSCSYVSRSQAYNCSSCRCDSSPGQFGGCYFERMSLPSLWGNPEGNVAHLHVLYAGRLRRCGCCSLPAMACSGAVSGALPGGS